jgi:hypothetical protein
MSSERCRSWNSSVLMKSKSTIDQSSILIWTSLKFRSPILLEADFQKVIDVHGKQEPDLDQWGDCHRKVVIQFNRQHTSLAKRQAQISSIEASGDSRNNPVNSILADAAMRLAVRAVCSTGWSSICHYFDMVELTWTGTWREINWMIIDLSQICFYITSVDAEMLVILKLFDGNARFSIRKVIYISKRNIHQRFWFSIQITIAFDLLKSQIIDWSAISSMNNSWTWKEWKGVERVGSDREKSFEIRYEQGRQ